MGKGCMVVEHDGTDLRKLIHQREVASPYPGMELVVDQLFAAVRHLLAHNIVHGDLKPGHHGNR